MVTSGMFFFGNAVFVCFGSVDIQPWNEQIAEDKTDCR